MKAKEQSKTDMDKTYNIKGGATGEAHMRILQILSGLPVLACSMSLAFVSQLPQVLAVCSPDVGLVL